MKNKICIGCKKLKFVSEFHKEKKSKDGLVSYCKDCRRSQKRNYYINNTEKILKKQHDAYIKNKEKHSLYYKKIRAENPEFYKLKDRKSKLKALYNITIEQYNNLLEKQNGVCAICGNSEIQVSNKGKLKRLHVDHNHKTGKIRGLLCSECNFGIGLFKENLSLFKTAMKYLEIYKHD